MENVIIIGGGCAGLTAAIYTARANLSPLVIEGAQPGGQLTLTTSVENFPGFPHGIDGPDLTQRMRMQAGRFGARSEYGTLEDFEAVDQVQRVKIDGIWRESRALIIASGASAKWLDLEGEEQLIGHGLTSCATCDGAFYKGVPVAVIGGGDSACEEALFLTRFCSLIYLVHRRGTLRASRIMEERTLTHPKIQPVWNSTVQRYLPDESGAMRAICIRNTVSGSQKELEVKCVFIAIGHTPNTAPFQGKLELDNAGYIVPRRRTQTSLPGVFAAGDVVDPVYRQAITAAGQGCSAAIDAERWLTAGYKGPERKRGEEEG
ncbi:MAG: thioredoxin-disulfide reductase [Candidatus Xiphinematobacter sp.]|nr:MAG: thioredoxin-disulfide reductase [Candidatus Xiphinematobacter sp.]